MRRSTRTTNIAVPCGLVLCNVVHRPEALGIVPATVCLMAAISLKWFFYDSVWAEQQQQE
jgi:hypothetical protein